LDRHLQTAPSFGDFEDFDFPCSEFQFPRQRFAISGISFLCLSTLIILVCVAIGVTKNIVPKTGAIPRGAPNRHGLVCQWKSHWRGVGRMLQSDRKLRPLGSPLRQLSARSDLPFHCPRDSQATRMKPPKTAPVVSLMTVIVLAWPSHFE
jgi:hypothetical protein